MRFQLENIGAIEKADIDIDGITIIAGENNVGKSTVGKALYAFLHDMSSWKKSYDDICSSRIKEFLYENSIDLEDWCMKVSGARRRRTSKADQLQKRYSKDENFLVAIEDFQVAEDEKGKAEAEENVKNYFLRYCMEYMALYFGNDELNLNNIKWNNLDWIEGWSDRVTDGVRLLELDELEIQIQQLRLSFQEVFNFQYQEIGTSESQISLTDDSGRKVKFMMNSAGEKLDQPIRVSNRIFFVESPKIYDYLSNTRFGHVQKDYLRYLMSPNIFKKGNQTLKFENSEFAIEKNDSEKKLRDIAEHLVNVMGEGQSFCKRLVWSSKMSILRNLFIR